MIRIFRSLAKYNTRLIVHSTVAALLCKTFNYKVLHINKTLLEKLYSIVTEHNKIFLLGLTTNHCEVKASRWVTYY